MGLFSGCVEGSKPVLAVPSSPQEEKELAALEAFLTPRLEKQIRYSRGIVSPEDKQKMAEASRVLFALGWRQETLAKIERALKAAKVACPEMTDWIWYNIDPADKSFVAFVDHESYVRPDFFANLSVNLAVVPSQQVLQQLPGIAAHEIRHAKERLFFQEFEPSCANRDGNGYSFNRERFFEARQKYLLSKMTPEQAEWTQMVWAMLASNSHNQKLVENGISEIIAWATGNRAADRPLFLASVREFLSSSSGSPEPDYANLKLVFSKMRPAAGALYAVLAREFQFPDLAANLDLIYQDRPEYKLLSQYYSMVFRTAAEHFTAIK